MSNHPIESILGASLEKIKEMIDVETIIGDPITTPDGTTIVPVSKVSFGFASGGSDISSKNPKDLFAGGSGAGVTISPIAFIVISNGDVKLLQMSMSANSSNAIINMVPDVIDKITEVIKKKDKTKE